MRFCFSYLLQWPPNSSGVASLTVIWAQAIHVGFLGHGVGDGVGFVLGLRQVLDGDQLVAVLTILVLGIRIPDEFKLIAENPGCDG